MKKVFLDIGNSRVKWAVESNGNYEYCGGLEVDAFINQIESVFFDQISHADAVYYCSVTDAHSIDTIKSLIQSHWQLIPTALSSQKDCCSLQSGYDDFHLLGDDRWMAMQGAISLTKEPVLVIDFGTAVTIDAVVDGKHLGGFIVPGLKSLRSALAKDTADLQLVSNISSSNEDQDYSQSLLATNTETAILGGTLYMTAAFINQLISDLNVQLSTQFNVFVTGGDAAQLQMLIDAKTTLEEDLVLQGMKKMVSSIKGR